MSALKAPSNTPVWVDLNRCKACDICVNMCPSGVLSMKADASSTLGAIIDIPYPEACIGCNSCELSCPDFAIFVAEKSEFKFAKLTNESKERATAIKENNGRLPDAYKKEQ